jgi:hypothetical protein
MRAMPCPFKLHPLAEWNRGMAGLLPVVGARRTIVAVHVPIGRAVAVGVDVDGNAIARVRTATAGVIRVFPFRKREPRVRAKDGTQIRRELHPDLLVLVRNIGTWGDDVGQLPSHVLVVHAMEYRSRGTVVTRTLNDLRLPDGAVVLAAVDRLLVGVVVDVWSIADWLQTRAAAAIEQNRPAEAIVAAEDRPPAIGRGAIADIRRCHIDVTAEVGFEELGSVGSRCTRSRQRHGL